MHVLTEEKLRLRDYQHKGIAESTESLKQGKSTILVMPTGAGKTVAAATLATEFDLPTLWIAHRRELIVHAAKRLRSLGLDVGIIMAGVDPDLFAQVQVASVQTLTRRKMPNAGLIVVDECHHATAESYSRILNAYRDSYVLGLTATPFRLDGRGLGDVFDSIIVAAYADELVARGTLIAPIVFAPDKPSLKGIRQVAGDYSPAGISALMDRPKLVANIISTWLKKAAGRRTVCFAVNVQHSMNIIYRFKAVGVRAEHLDGNTPKFERDEILERLRTGETEIVSNCMVLTEGWDLPALECAIIARPTASKCLHLQCVGRIMRAPEGKTSAIVLDHVGNHLQHGFVTDRFRYTLSTNRPSATEKQASVGSCYDCGCIVPAGTQVCPNCGCEIPLPEVPEDGAGNLVQLTSANDEFIRRAKYWNYLERTRLQRGFRSGWSLREFQERFDEWPIIAFGKLLNPTKATIEQKSDVYRQLNDLRIAKGFQKGWVAHKYREIFNCWPRGVA